jgi:nitroimidazol reductase NimA-like FMN-containing flavoprotein (pyridoxamine 5'-phosphate oxidase superfamily)
MMAFPEMRRKDRMLSTDAALQIIQNNRLGYLGMLSPTGYPYVVPMNYAFQNDTFYLHCAKEGHKIESLRNHPEVCFTVVGEWQIIPEHTTTAFESVIAFGQACFIDNPDEKKAALNLLLKQCGVQAPLEDSCEPSVFERTAIIAIKIEHLTGKRRLNPLSGS